jgi:hypothetical protein
MEFRSNLESGIRLRPVQQSLAWLLLDYQSPQSLTDRVWNKNEQ